MTAREHNRLVGLFLMAHGGFQAVIMVLMGVIYGVIGSAMLVGGRQGEDRRRGIYRHDRDTVYLFTTFPPAPDNRRV